MSDKTCKWIVVATAVAAVLVVVCMLATQKSPHVTIRYSSPQARVALKIVRTIACDAERNDHLVDSMTMQSEYAADTTASLGAIKVSDLDGLLRDTELEFQLYEDGRLKAVNTTSTGNGEAVLRAASTLASTAVGGGVSKTTAVAEHGAGAEPSESGANAKAAAGTVHGKQKVDAPTPTAHKGSTCSRLNRDEKSTPITVTYEATLDFQRGEKGKACVLGPPVEIPPRVNDERWHTIVKDDYGSICAQQLILESSTPAFKWDPEDKAGPYLTLVRPAQVEIQLSQSEPLKPCDDKARRLLGRFIVAVPQCGAEYELPLPKASIWRTQSFKLSLAESGAITLLKYGKTDGTQMVLGAGTAIAGVGPQSASQQAAARKAEADILAEQQRIATCLSNPTQCK